MAWPRSACLVDLEVQRTTCEDAELVSLQLPPPQTVPRLHLHAGATAGIPARLRTQTIPPSSRCQMRCRRRAAAAWAVLRGVVAAAA